MAHSAPLISTLVFGLVLAFGFGLIAQRLRLPPLIGYLLAGIAIGPFTPGFVADQGVANQLAEIGVILLMFGVGLHFSLDDLLSVRAIAIPGALAQTAVATPLGMAVGWWRGWTPGAGLVFGIALSIASTVVLLRLLQERRLLDTERGRITVGWLIVQDLGMVLVLVLLPALAGVLKGTEDAPDPSQLLQAITLTLGKIAAFVIIMLVVGRKVIPLHPALCRPYRQPRAVPPSRAVDRSWLRLPCLRAVRRFSGARRLFRRHDLERVAIEPAGGDRIATIARRLCRAVLRLGRHAVRSGDRCRMRQLALFATIFIILVAKTAAAYLVVRLFGHPLPTAPCHLGQPRADRRVFLHPRRARRGAGGPAG